MKLDKMGVCSYKPQIVIVHCLWLNNKYHLFYQSHCYEDANIHSLLILAHVCYPHHAIELNYHQLLQSFVHPIKDEKEGK